MAPNLDPTTPGLYDPSGHKDNCGVGFVADIQGRASHRIVEQGLEILVNLTHRGAVGADAYTGDGAGILLQKPDAFLRKAASAAGISLPEDPADYGAGLVFLPADDASGRDCMATLERIAAEEGQTILGWREVEGHPEEIAVEPHGVLDVAPGDRDVIGSGHPDGAVGGCRVDGRIRGVAHTRRTAGPAK